VNHFESGHVPEDLGRKAVRGGAISGAGQAAQFAVLAIGTVVLARLLTPKDYGLVAMVTAITSVVAGFKDLGLAASTVQQPEVTHQQTSTLFWVNVAFGLLLTVLISVAAPALAWFYDEPRVSALAVAIASTFLISGLGTQHHSLLRRQLRFTELATIELVATVVAVGVAIGAALNGASYWSLVLLYVLVPVCIAIGAWLRCSWRPGRPARSAAIAGMLSYGGYLTGFNIVNSMLRSFDRILIGLTASAVPLGLYSRASFLVFIPTERLSGAATSVAIPILSRLQDDLPRYRAFVLMATLLYGAIAIPFGWFAFAGADSIVLAVLGEKWMGTSPILRALAPMAVFATLEAAAMWVSASAGHTARQFRVGVWLAIVAGVAMAVGLRWGVIGVATAFSSAYAVSWIAGLRYCLEPSPVNLSDVMRVLWRPMLASIAGVVVMIGGARLGPELGSATLALARDLTLFAVTYGAAWMVIPGGRATIHDMRTLAKALRR
jgi:O-antigen/teichoic acid export membrane protein